jgi:RNA polymerase sigma factor (sigma-70 family)
VSIKAEAEESFRHLYGNYYPAVKAFFRRFGLEPDEARDLAQETFLRVYERMDEYRGEAGWAYLEVLARNILYNHIRAQKTSKRSATLIPIEEIPFLEDSLPSSEDIAAEFDRREEARRLQTAIDNLPAGMRNVITLFLLGHSYEEISKLMRLSPDAVKSRIRDAKQRLRSAFSDARRSDDLDE